MPVQAESLLAHLDSPINSPQEVYNVLTLRLGGFSVHVGKNAFSNEYMVAEHQKLHPRCLWFHALGAGGSHVILCIEGTTIPTDEVIQAVGKLAIEYSRSRGTTVRIARLEQLHKPKDSGVGVWHAKHFATREAM